MIASDYLLIWINKIILVDLGYGQVITGRLISIRDDELLHQRRFGSRLAVNMLEAKLIRPVRNQQA
jgi:hypothetical protein